MKRFLSFIVVNLAVFIFTVSFLIWMLDATILKADVLLPALQKSGTHTAIANAVPQLIESNENPEEATQIRQKVKEVLSEDYVQLKLNGFIGGFITFIKDGKPEPSLDVSDLPDKIRATGLEVPDEMSSQLSKPITFTDKNAVSAFASIHNGYKISQLAKYIAPLFGALMLVALWFLAPKDKRLRGVGIVGINLAFWAGVYWLVLSKAPAYINNKIAITDQGSQGAAMQDVFMSILKAISGLLMNYFMWFAIATSSVGFICLVLPSLWRKVRKS